MTKQVLGAAADTVGVIVALHCIPVVDGCTGLLLERDNQKMREHGP